MSVFSEFLHPLPAALARSPPLSASTPMQRKPSQCPLATISLGDQPNVSNCQEAQGSTARWWALPSRVAHLAETG